MSIETRARKSQKMQHMNNVPPMTYAGGAGEEKEEYLPVRRIKSEVSMQERRMDALAVLLAAKSICISVAVIEEELYVAANGLHSGSRNNAVVRGIAEIAGYFKELCGEKKPSEQEREAIFQSIFSIGRMFNVVQPRALVIKKNMPEEIALQVLHSKSADVGLRETMQSQKSDAGAFGLLYGECTKLHIPFSKLGKSIEDAKSLYADGCDVLMSSGARKRTLKPLHPEQFNALSNFTEENILHIGSKSEVHAEMQMLSHILDTVVRKRALQKKKGNFNPLAIYIGASKLCCMHCWLTLQAANEALEEKGLNITLKMRGTHGLSFDKWKYPDLFKENADNSDGSFTALLQEIKSRAKEKIEVEEKRKAVMKEIKKRQKEKKPDAVSQAASQSESEVEFSVEEMCTQKIAALEKRKNDLLFSIDAQKEIETIQKITLAMQLYAKVEGFKLLLEGEVVDRFDQRFSAIQMELAAKTGQAKIEPELLLKVLQDKTLVDEEIGKHFIALPIKKAGADNARKRGPLSPLPCNRVVRQASVSEVNTFGKTHGVANHRSAMFTRATNKRKENDVCRLFGETYTYEEGREKTGNVTVEIFCSGKNKSTLSEHLYTVFSEEQLQIKTHSISVRNRTLEELMNMTKAKAHVAPAACGQSVSFLQKLR